MKNFLIVNSVERDDHSSISKIYIDVAKIDSMYPISKIQTAILMGKAEFLVNHSASDIVQRINAMVEDLTIPE